MTDNNKDVKTACKQLELSSFCLSIPKNMNKFEVSNVNGTHLMLKDVCR